MSALTPSVLRKSISDKKVLIDTNIIIYLTDWVQPYAALSKLIFQMIENGDASAVLSIISIAEVMGGPIKKGQYKTSQDKGAKVKNYPQITPVPSAGATGQAQITRITGDIVNL